MEQLHPKAVWLFFFRFVFTGFLFLIFLLIFFVSLLGELAIKAKPVYIWLALILGFVFAFGIYTLICYVWARLTYKFYRYELSEDCYKAESGIIYKRYISIPYERIQNVDIYRGILDRILGLSDLQIQTAGYGAAGAAGSRRGFGSEGRLPGLGREKAEGMRSELIKRAKGAKEQVGI